MLSVDVISSITLQWFFQRNKALKHAISSSCCSSSHPTPRTCMKSQLKVNTMPKFWGIGGEWELKINAMVIHTGSIHIYMQSEFYSGWWFQFPTELNPQIQPVSIENCQLLRDALISYVVLSAFIHWDTQLNRRILFIYLFQTNK